MIEPFEDLIGPPLQETEVDQQAFFVERFGRDRDLDEEIMAVELFALAADLLEQMGGGKGFF